MVIEELDQYLIDEINNIQVKVSVQCFTSCKHCGRCHQYYSYNCGIVIFWYVGEEIPFNGRIVEAPDHAVHWRRWRKDIDKRKFQE